MFTIEKLSTDGKLIAGTYWEVSQEVAEYPATSYKLQYILRKSTEAAFSAETIPDGELHLLTVDASVTTDLTGGNYHCLIYAISLDNETVIIPVASIVLYIHPDPLTSTDSRSFELKVIDKLETALLALADRTMSSISIDGRSYTYNDMAKMEQMRDYYKQRAGIKTENTGRKRILAKFSNE